MAARTAARDGIKVLLVEKGSLLKFCGAGGWSRTTDLLITKEITWES